MKLGTYKDRLREAARALEIKEAEKKKEEKKKATEKAIEQSSEQKAFNNIKGINQQ